LVHIYNGLLNLFSQVPLSCQAYSPWVTRSSRSLRRALIKIPSVQSDLPSVHNCAWKANLIARKGF
jgi:hypothetical protein